MWTFFVLQLLLLSSLLLYWKENHINHLNILPFTSTVCYLSLSLALKTRWNKVLKLCVPCVFELTRCRSICSASVSRVLILDKMCFQTGSKSERDGGRGIKNPSIDWSVNDCQIEISFPNIHHNNCTVLCDRLKLHSRLSFTRIKRVSACALTILI